MMGWVTMGVGGGAVEGWGESGSEKGVSLLGSAVD